MKIDLSHMLRCVVCGPFGRRARRRARDAADAAHIAWAAGLVAARRCNRCPEWVEPHDRGYCAHAQMRSWGAAPTTVTVEISESETTELPPLPPDLAVYRRWRKQLRADLRAAMAEVEAAEAAAIAERQHAELDEYDTDDVVAEVVGPMGYDEQSQMIGDPIADVIRRETE